MESLPKIIYGTAWKKTDTQRLVELAVRNGFRGIDTACQPKHYDEAAVGAAVTKLREHESATSARLIFGTPFKSSASPKR